MWWERSQNKFSHLSRSDKTLEISKKLISEVADYPFTR